MSKNKVISEHFRRLQKKSAKVRWARMTPEQRREFASRISRARWGKKEAGQ